MVFRFSSMLTRRGFAGMALAGVLALGACGGDDSSGPSGTVYTLRSVDGASIPIVETDPTTGDVYTVKSGSLRLNSNGTYNGRVTETYKPSGQPLQTLTYGEDGTYVESGSTITFTSTHDVEGSVRTPSTGDVTTGTKSGSTLTLAVSGSTLVFTR